MPAKPAYKRILLKLSGEALAGDGEYSIDPKVVDQLVGEIVEVHHLGVEVGIVIGGGNFFRGAQLSHLGIKRVSADYMGMLGTLMNALALRDAFERAGAPARVHSAIPMSGVVDHFNSRKAMHNLAEKRVLIFAGGTGNPLVTTDYAASLRGVQVEADVLLKATQVDGVYDKDPKQHSDAERYARVGFDEVLSKELKVMDLAAFAQCRDFDLPIIVFNLHASGNLMRVVCGESVGTVVSN